MPKKVITLFIFFKSIFYTAYTQTDNNSFLYVFTTNESAKPLANGKSNNSELNSILELYNVTKYFQSFPNAKTAELNNIFSIYTNGNIGNLKTALFNSSLFYRIDIGNFYTTEAICNNPIITNDSISNNWLVDDWAIHMIEGPCAYSVTTGSPNIKIGIVDTEFDLNHEDLSSQVQSVWGVQNTGCHHGTIVTGCAAAATNNGKGIMGIGYNSKIKAYCVGNGCSGDPWPGIWQAYLDGCKIINVSWSGIGSYPSFLAVQEIVSNGTVLVTSAGNSTASTAHSIYANIPGVINVSSVNKNNSNGPTGHAQNQWVDLCAPGFAISSTYNPNLSGGNKYGGGWGTSFAAPYVSGTAALIFAVNPCLRPTDVESIIKATTDSIADGNQFLGLLGTGRLNSYKAVLLAQTYGNTIPLITSNTTWITDKYIKGDVTIDGGSTLTINNGAKIFFENDAKIIVKPNAKLIIDSATLTSNCFWQGIEVWGNSSQHQYTYSGNQLYQGFVELKNGALIENAAFAIFLGKPDDWLNIYTGGIVQADSAIFRNNKRDIAFLKYKNFNPQNPLQKRGNLSFFRKTRFETTANLNNGSFPSNHVTMWNVDGVRFYGCTLEINNGVLSDEVKQQLLADYQTYDQLLNQYKGFYTSLIDGGNTALMKQAVENSGTSEIWQLRQKLLGESPYLSKEVLKESSDKTNVLPDAVIFEIFAANPDGVKDEKLMKYLSEKVKPLPEWMIELLQNGSNQTTPRTFLEAAISNTKAQRDRTITYLVQDMISKQQENEEIDHPQLRSWLAAYQTPHGDYQIVDDYFETGNYSAALSILSTIPTVYSLNEKEAEEFTGLQSLFNVLSTVHSTNRNIFLLNENERSAIQNLADNGEGIAKVRACNILSFVYGTECNYNLKLPEANHFFKTDNAPAGKDNPLLPFINAFPNPAKDYIEFSYNLPVGAMEGALSITDLKGMVIHKQQLTAKYGQIAIDTRQWQQGAYLYILSANGKMVANHKFVLVK
ncbi:MAG: S8 family serine peptidase [Chitinophagales bacterium]|nr:S8 family serine peptidase [Chitinophagales bacterium]